MSNNFNGSSNWIEGAAVLTDYPATLACWFRTTTVATAQSLISVGESVDRSRFHMLISTTGPSVAAVAVGGNNVSGTAFSSSSPSANTWHHAATTFTSTTSRSAFLDGANKGTGTGSTDAVVGFDTTVIGARYQGGLGQYFSGRIAEVGIWNVVLTDAEIASLGRGFSPRLVRPQSLVFYAPMIRDLQDVRKGLSLTNNGTTVADHPRIYA